MCMIYDVFLEFDLNYTDPAQHLITAGYTGRRGSTLDHDLSDLSEVGKPLEQPLEHPLECRK